MLRWGLMGLGGPGWLWELSTDPWEARVPVLSDRLNLW